MPSQCKASAIVNATPWTTGATVGKPQSLPGVGVYLHFLAPPYSRGDEVPFFGFHGDATVQYSCPRGVSPQIVRRGPVKGKTAAPQVAASTSAKPEQSLDEEDFPWQKLVSDTKDPAVKTHLQKYFAQKPAMSNPGTPLPAIKETASATIVAAKSVPHDATLPRRTRTMVNVTKLRRSDDLAGAAGFPRRTFEAIDSQHVFVLGTDGALRLDEGPFNSTGGNAKPANTSTIIDRGIKSFEAVSLSKVLTLRDDGALLTVSAPFSGAPGICVQGFVWRDAYAGDHICVTPGTRSQAVADNAAAASRVTPSFPGSLNGTCVPGFVWREANAKDHVCVSPGTRAQTALDNTFGPRRVAGAGSTRLLGSPVSKFQAMANGDTMVLDTNGKLWLAGTSPASPAKPVQVAMNVRAFQNTDTRHTLILTTDDRLQPYPGAVLGTVPEVYENIWAFEQAGDGSLFEIDTDDVLWRAQPRRQIDTNVRKLQALDANTVFVLKYDGTLWLRRTDAPLLSQLYALVASGVRAFQALDAQTVWTLDEGGKLWLERGNFGPQTPTRTLVATDVR
jgi:hypothetical protein